MLAEAAWLHICALCYCGRNLTDGVFPARLVSRLAEVANPVALASTLLGADLWHDSGHTCSACPRVDEGNYLIHDYLEHQRSAEDVRSLSERRKAAGQRGGNAKAAGRAASNGLASATASARHDAKQTPSKSVAETETETETETENNNNTSSASAEGFNAFYAAYPRKVGKIAARKAWDKAAAHGDPQAIVDGVRRYAADPNLPEEKFIPHPSKWLNDGRWQDGPLAPRGRPAKPSRDQKIGNHGGLVQAYAQQRQADAHSAYEVQELTA